MKGGWTSRQVAKLLVKHGLREGDGGGRRRRKGGEEEEEEDDDGHGDRDGGGGEFDGAMVEVDVEGSLDPPMDVEADALLMGHLSDDDIKDMFVEEELELA
jgi:hypothetical protein